MNLSPWKISTVLLICVTIVTPTWSQDTDDSEMMDAMEDPEFLISALSHPGARIRQNALDTLVEMEKPPYKELVKVLATGEEFSAAAAALTLMRIQKKQNDVPVPEDIEKSLYDILSSLRPKIWRWNITATVVANVAEPSLKDHIELWTWGVRQSSPLLQLPSLRALQKSEADGQSAELAVAGLLDRTHKPLTSIMLRPKLMTDGLLGYEQAVPDFDPLTIMETLVAIKANPNLYVSRASALLHHGNEYMQLGAASILRQADISRLSYDPRPQAVRTLAHLATEPRGKVRREAIKELGEMGEPAVAALPTLKNLLKDPSNEVRLAAATSLGKLGKAAMDALPELKEALKFAKLDTQESVTAITEAIEAIENGEPEKEPTGSDT